MLHLYFQSLKIIVIFGFILNCTFSHGQENIYFDNHPVWQESTSCGIPAPCIETDEYNYFIDGDTILDGITYVKLYKQGVISRMYYDNYPPDYCSGSEFYSYQYGYLRSENRQMFYREVPQAQETLLYDFNLAVGDTLPPSEITVPWNTIVTDVDSINVMGNYYKVFYLNGDNASFIIEGVGSSKGLLAPIPLTFECGFSLNCYSQYTNSYYIDNDGGTISEGDGGTCMLTVGVDETSELPQISLYPNPAADVVQIELAEVKGQVEISVHNLAGKEVKHATARGEQLYQLNCGDLPNGLYVLMLRQNDLVLYSTKLAVLR